MKQGLDEYIKPIAERLRDQERQVLLAMNEFTVRLKKQNEKAPEVILELSRRGWFLGLIFHILTVSEIYELIKTGQFDKVDQWMAHNVKRSLNFIEGALIMRNPKREAIFKEAFENHRKGRYYSSITLLISQVDGMCKDRFDHTFFSKARNKSESKLKSSITELNLMGVDYLKVVFNELTAINDDSNKADNYPLFLNRHNILHGFDTEYGNEINSLRVISFLNYINDVVCMDMQTGLPR